MVPVLLLQIPGAPELLVILLILILFVGIPVLLLAGGGIAAYLIFWRDDEEGDEVDPTADVAEAEAEREPEDV